MRNSEPGTSYTYTADNTTVIYESISGLNESEETEITPELTRGNRKSQFHECAGELTSKSIPTLT